MKKLFISMLAIVALVACSKDEVVDANKGELISFGNAFVDNATKAEDPSYSANDIEKFSVYGTVTASDNSAVVIYPGTEITKGNADYGTAWTCPVNQYWIPGANYKFIGIVDGNVSGITETTLENNMPTSISYNADGKTDLLCQTIEKTANTDGLANGLVEFTFTHLLSKVNFTVTNKSTEADDYSFVVKNIKFNGYTSGKYDVSNEEWETFTDDNKGTTIVGNTRTITTGGTDTEVQDIVIPAKTASVELQNEVLFLPGEVTIEFTVDILYEGNVITTNNYPVSTETYKYTLEAAKAYNFNIEVSVGELIKFTVSEQPTWENGNTSDNNNDSVDDAVVLG